MRHREHYAGKIGEARRSIVVSPLPVIVGHTLSPAGGQDCHGDASKKSAPGSYQVTPDRWQRLLRARPDSRQINAKAPCGPIVEMGQTVPARTTRFLRNQAETD
jgi:hypothetical protein